MSLYNDSVFETNIAMNELNNKLRDELREKASAFGSEREKIAYIVKYFLQNYNFDYSVLKNEYKELGDREPQIGKFYHNGKWYNSPSYACVYPDEKHRISLSPSLHALKMGTCAYFSKELLWFAREFGINCELINEKTMCYDGYACETYDICELRPMMHYYVIMTLDGEECKIDVAGALMAKDYARYTGKDEVSYKDFVFVDPKKANPFDKIGSDPAMGDQ